MTSGRRADLASFLRTRRERLTPESVGLPGGSRRRTPGLRREELAQLAGVGVTWYTWLEQGRPIRASVQVLDAVSRTLRLDPAEHEHLYRLADVPRPPSGPSVPHPPPELQTIMDALSPFPACALTERFDVVAANRAYLALFPTMIPSDGESRGCNIIKGLFACPGCNPFADGSVELPLMVATFRAAYARHAGEPEWDRLVAELQETGPRFTDLWHTHDVAAHDTSRKVFRHPAIGTLSFTSTSLSVLPAADLRLTVYTPEDDGTRTVMDKLISGELALPRCPHS
ncbi:helix-turn-helix transcriptional regulator [Actinocorallia lasiicapitis]